MILGSDVNSKKKKKLVTAPGGDRKSIETTSVETCLARENFLPHRAHSEGREGREGFRKDHKTRAKSLHTFEKPAVVFMIHYCRVALA